MKSVSLLRWAYNRAIFRALLVGTCTVNASSVFAQQTYYWDTNPNTATAGNNVREGGAGTWNNTTANFTRSITDAAATNHNVWSSAATPIGVGTLGTDRVIFGGNAGGIVQLDAFASGAQLPASTSAGVNSLSFETDGYTLQGSNVLLLYGTNPDISVNSSLTATINNVLDDRIGGISDLTKSGAGVLVLGGANAYTGVTTINGGVLSVSSMLVTAGTSSGLGVSSSNIVLNGGALRYTGAAVNSIRTFTVGTSGGTLEASGSGALNLTSTGAIGLSGTNTARTFTLTGTNTGNNIYAGSLVDNGTGATSVTKSGTGVWILSNANTYAGVTTIEGGVLSISNLADGGLASGIGDSTNAAANVVLNGGTLRYTGAATSSNRAFTVGTNGGTIEANGTGALNLNSTSATGLSGTNTARTLTLSGTSNGSNTYAAALGDNGTGATSLTKSGTGLWVVSGASTYTGITTVSSGVLRVSTLANGGVSSSVGASSNAAPNLVLNGGTLQYTGAAVSSDRAFTLGTTGTIDASGSGALNLTSTGATAFSGTTARTLTLTGTSTANNTYAGVLGNGTGGTSLTKTGAGTWILSGANTYTGTTAVNRGTLTLNTSTGSMGASPISMGGGTFNLDNTGAGAALTESLGSLTFSSGDSTASITRTAASDQAVNFGSLGTRGAGATGNFVNAGGTNGGSNGFNLTGRAAGFIDQGTFFGGSSYAWMNAAGTFVRGINYGTDGGTSNTTTSVAALPAGANAQVSGAGIVTLQTAATLNTLQIANANNFTLAAGATLTVNGILKSGNAAGGSITGGTGITPSNNAELVVRTDLASDSLTIATPILATGSNALTKSGAGTLTLTGTNTYNGRTVINAGVLSVSNLANGGTNSGLGVSSNASSNLILNGGALRYVGAAVSSDRAFTLGITGGTLDASGTGALNLTSTAATTLSGTNTARALTLAGTNTGNNIYAGILGDNGTGTSTIIKEGTGTWVLSGANTYTGVTAINNGVLSISSNANLGAQATGAAINLNGGTLRATTTLGLWNTNAGVNDRNVVLSAGGGSFDVAVQNETLTVAGTITGTGGLTKTGLGVLEIRQASYSGPTNVNAGILSFGATIDPALSAFTVAANGTLDITGFSNTIGSLAGGGTVTNSGGIATLSVGALPGNSTFSGKLTNEASGLSLNKIGSGTLTLTGADNNYTGTTTISAGTLALTGTGALPASTQLTVASATSTFDISGISGTTSTVATLSGVSGSSVALGGKSLMMSSGISSGEFTYAGTASGTGGLTKEGPSIQIFTGASTFSGPTLITGGAILANNLSGSALGTSNVTVNAIGSFDPLLDPVTFGGTGSVSGIVTLANGGTLAPGASVGTLRVGGANGLGNLNIEFDSSLGIFDRLNVTGALNLDNFALNFTDLALVPGTLTSQNYVFATYGSLSGTTRTFSSIAGTPNGYLVNYAFNGNNVALVAVPEPGSLALIVVAGLSGVWYRRKRQQVPVDVAG
ncbi:MAG: autotransporter-associated beta strand repeat-containing protein [Planctomycetota bacterium]|nr:autotransporter-associated beta strand repeat-containing protein [Planctomycetota bacterium]